MPLALTVALLPLLAVAPPWVWPIDPPHSIVHPYIAPDTPYAAGHRGVDLAAPARTVYAPDDGVVHFAGTVVDRPVLSIKQAGGVLTSFEPVTTTLVAGDTVERGEVIGVVLPGHCASVCLHFGVRVDGGYVSPLRWLGGFERAVLIPTRSQSARSPRREGGPSGSSP
ncbi:MAG: M23 family metallopeptidase [Salinibacterium sp.]|nr:M23 family metallopeptidase [Salinibacterium sp.]